MDIGINLKSKNGYLLHRIIDSFPRILKWRILGLKPVLSASRAKVPAFKTGIQLYFYFSIRGKFKYQK